MILGVDFGVLVVTRAARLDEKRVAVLMIACVINLYWLDRFDTEIINWDFKTWLLMVRIKGILSGGRDVAIEVFVSGKHSFLEWRKTTASHS